MNDFIHGCHGGKTHRVTGTIDDIIHGFQGALWMISLMVATEGGEHQVTPHAARCAGIYHVICLQMGVAQ